MSAVPRSPSVLVSVGTDFHPFDRLVAWVDEWLGTRPGGEVPCLVQYGSSRPPERAAGVPFLGHDDLGSVMASALVVVCHGGPSTIAEARHHGHRPIVVPRSPGLGEHVDDHQQRFSRRLAETGRVRLVLAEQDLRDALEDALAAPAVTRSEPDLAHLTAAEAALRFGELVDTMFAERRR